MKASTSSRLAWHPTRSLAGAIIVGALFLSLGVAVSRPDIACFGVPLVAWAAWRWQNRPGTHADAALDAELSPLQRSSGITVPFSIAIRTTDAAVMARLRVRTGGVEDHEFVLAAQRSFTASGAVPALHSGPFTAVACEFRLFSADAAFVSEASSVFAAESVVPPLARTIPRVVLPARLQGLSGAHESARPGDGGEFRDIHPFAPGDRLRRIDWKATARLGRRPGDLYVRRTDATSDASIVIVMDTSTEVGEVVAEWTSGDPRLSGAHSMDIAREAAASLATAYVETGDQVAFQDLALGAKQVRRGSGDRHRARLLTAIAGARAHGASWLRRRAPVLPSGALVYVLSTFMDDEAARLAVMWRAGGHRVVAVDVLPSPILDGLTREQATAHRIVMMERADRLYEIESAGVELLRWSDDGRSGSRDARLRALSRGRRR